MSKFTPGGMNLPDLLGFIFGAQNKSTPNNDPKKSDHVCNDTNINPRLFGPKRFAQNTNDAKRSLRAAATDLAHPAGTHGRGSADAERKAAGTQSPGFGPKCWISAVGFL